MFSIINIIERTAESHSEPSQASKMELFERIVRSLKAITVSQNIPS